MKRILIPIPSYGFDPTEVAIPWKLISEKDFEIVFITPDGKKASADIHMLKVSICAMAGRCIQFFC